MKTRHLLPLAVLLVSGVYWPAATAAADVAPSHQCLPDETVVVVRVPQGLRFVEAFRNETKLGQVLLSCAASREW